MKKLMIIASIATVFSATAGLAGCVGTSSFYSCSDSSGNSYSVQKFGNSTYMSGRNSRTGSSWNQTTNRVGNNSFTTGRASNGRSWNMTSTPYGSFGTDSSGNHFNSYGN